MPTDLTVKPSPFPQTTPDSAKPFLTKVPAKPAPNFVPDIKPVPTETHYEAPDIEEDNIKPSPFPQTTPDSGKPFLTKVPAKPAPNYVPDKPIPTKAPEKPVPTDVTVKPLITKEPVKLISTQSLVKPLYLTLTVPFKSTVTAKTAIKPYKVTRTLQISKTTNKVHANLQRPKGDRKNTAREPRMGQSLQEDTTYASALDSPVIFGMLVGLGVLCFIVIVLAVTTFILCYRATQLSLSDEPMQLLSPELASVLSSFGDSPKQLQKPAGYGFPNASTLSPLYLNQRGTPVNKALPMYLPQQPVSMAQPATTSQAASLSQPASTSQPALMLQPASMSQPASLSQHASTAHPTSTANHASLSQPASTSQPALPSIEYQTHL